jgi:hypothetical protein
MLDIVEVAIFAEPTELALEAELAELATGVVIVVK